MTLWRTPEGTLHRGITVAKLTQMLNGIPDDLYIEGNRVGNLLVHDGEHNIGYLDVASETYEPFDEH